MLDKVRRGGAALAVLLPSFLVLALLIVSLLLRVCDYLGDPTAFNSDSLLSSAQCDDLLHGREVTEWHLPGAPYIFPDLLLLAPCQFLMPTLPLAFLTYCFVLHFVLAAILIWLGRLSGLCWRPAILSVGCGCLLLVALSLNEIRSDRAILLVRPGSHFAAIVVGLFLLALTVHLLQRGLSWTPAIVYLLVGSFGSFSDRLLAAQFLAPLAVALILLAGRKVISVKQAGVPLTLLAASLLLSSIIKWLFARLGFHLLALDASVGKLHLPDLFSMLRRLYQGISGDYLLCLLIPLHFLVAFVVARSWIRRTDAASETLISDRRSVLLAALTFVLSPLCIVGALFVLGMSHQAAVGRYTLSCWFLPPLLLPLLLCWLPGRPARAALGILRAGIVLFAAQRVWMMLPALEPARFEQPYPPLAQELDRLARQRGPMYGLGGFWTARSTGYFTREKVTVNALSVMGEPWFHASNPARFLADNDDLRLPSHPFLIVRPNDSFGPSVGVLALQFGMPAERIAVGDDEIWLYDSLRVPAFERFLRSRLAERLHRHRPYTGPSEPACLAQPKANMTPADAPGLVAVEAGEAREVRFAQPITGQLLDIAANDEAILEVEFFHGAERLGRLPVPSVPWTGACYNKPGIQSRLLPLPALLRQRPWDRLVVRADPTSENVRLGHVLVYGDRIAGLEERPLPHLSRVRLESEQLLPINPGTPFSDEIDATASGGRARRSSVNFRCCFNYTPRLFLPPGRYRLECAMKVDDNSRGEEVVSLTVDCLLPHTSLAKRSLRGGDFPAAGCWTVQKTIFEVSENENSIQVFVAGSGKTPVAVDYLDLIAEEPCSPREEKRATDEHR